MKHKLASSVGSALLYSQIQEVQAQVTQVARVSVAKGNTKEQE